MTRSRTARLLGAGDRADHGRGARPAARRPRPTTASAGVRSHWSGACSPSWAAAATGSPSARPPCSTQVEGSPDLYRAPSTCPRAATRTRCGRPRASGRELRGRRRPRWQRHPAGRARRHDHLHLRPRDARHQRRRPGGPAQGAGAHWLSARCSRSTRGRPPPARTSRLYAAPDGGLAVEDGEVTGGTALPLTLDAAGSVRAAARALPPPGRLDRAAAAGRRSPSPGCCAGSSRSRRTTPTARWSA